MTLPLPGLSWPGTQQRVEMAELAQACDLTVDEVRELVAHGALVPLGDEEAGPVLQFSAGCLPPLREATRLRALYGLDLLAVSLLLGYLHRIEDLEHQLRALQAHVPHPSHLPREGPTPWREPHA